MTKPKTSCMLEDCSHAHYSRGLCIKHHRLHSADGTLDTVALPRKNTTAPWHRLTDKDEAAGVATCSVCGPNTPIDYRKAAKTWRCSSKSEEAWEAWHKSAKGVRVYRYGSDNHPIPREEAVQARARFKVEQGDLCAICNEPADKALHLDHCHETGVFRGLLCRNHNLALGFFKDNIDHLRAAIEYLEKV